MDGPLWKSNSRRRAWKLFLVVALAIPAVQAMADEAAAQAGNPVLNQLLQGVPFPGNQTRKLHEPSLPDGLTGPQQEEAVGAVLAKKLGAR